MAKVREPLGLADSLKVQSESGVFNQWGDNQVSVGTLCYVKNKDLFKSALHTTCLWKCIMAQTKEISEDPKKSC